MMQNTMRANRPITIPMMAPVGSLEVPSDRAGAEGSPVKVNLGVNHTVTNLQLGGIDERFIIMFNRFLP